MKRLGPVMMVAALAACVPASTMQYTPPGPAPTISDQRDLSISPAEAWDNLVDYLSTSYMEVELLDKESGIARFSWADRAASAFIECGEVVDAPYIQDGLQRGTITGSYADYLSHRTGYSGAANIRITKGASGNATVKVHARFSLSSRIVETNKSHRGERELCHSTGAVEKMLLDAVSGTSEAE